ncbi:TPA: hypothetical protein ACH3X2_007723 [Trebouxia sp. C0005]
MPLNTQDSAEGSLYRGPNEPSMMQVDQDDFACDPAYSNGDCSISGGYIPTHARGHSTTSSERSLDIRAKAVLRVETMSRQSLKRYAFAQFFLRIVVVASWVVLSKLSLATGFYHQHEQVNLALATGLSAACLAVSGIALFGFLWRVIKVFRANKQWSLRRKRLAMITLAQLASLVIAILFFLAPAAYATKQHCNSIAKFCRWCLFVQWSAWNMVLLTQLVFMHCTCAWTDADGKACRKLWMNFTPLTSQKPKNGLILDAPWSLHLPKLLIWMVIQATVITQLVVSLDGSAFYKPNANELKCITPLMLCVYNVSNHTQFIIRCVALGIWSIWYFVLVFQGLTDMARMPFETFRMGRMLIRMVCSRDFSLGSNMLPAVSLVWGTVFSRCSSCQPTYVVLGLIVCCTILTCMSSRLLQPVSMSTDDDLLMQVWLQQFAWTEQSHEAKLRKRNAMPEDECLIEAEPMFCFETAVKLLYWSGFVYEDDEGVDVPKETAMQLYNLEHLELVRDPLTNTKCLVAWGQDTVLVAFRGTANKQNAIHDLKAWLVPHNAEEEAKIGYCGFGAVPAVHSGFSVSWQGALRKAVCSIVSGAAGSEGHNASKMRLLVTGHSLGGAMAVLAAYDFVDLCPWKSVQVYTIGAPRPGNKAFSDKYEAKVPDTWHVMNSQDPVPKVGKFGVLYARPGQRVILDAGGEMQVRPTQLDVRLSTLNPFRQIVQEMIPVLSFFSRFTALSAVKSHYLLTYNQRFVEIIKGQLKKPRFEDGLEGVLHLANSVSLKDTLQAADLDVSVGQARGQTP